MYQLVDCLVLQQHSLVGIIKVAVLLLIYLGRVVEPDLRVQFEVGELHQGGVELQKSAHDLVVHLGRHLLGELVGHDPVHSLALDLRLVVDALDAQEHLAQTLALYQVQVELSHQSAALLNHSLFDLVHLVRREDTVQTEQTERVI